jgi:TfoX/Sxy family transcriptional regulator of competence genes
MKSRKRKPPEKPTPAAIDPRFAPVAAVFAAHGDVSQGKLMSSYGLRVNGKIFAMYGRGKFVVKLPKAQVDEAVSQGRGERFDPGHGRLMKEWLAMTGGESTWVETAKSAYRFVKQAGA